MISKHVLADLCQEALKTSWELIRITIPVAVITRFLEQFGVIELLSTAMAPVMSVLGLPGQLGIVWATTLLTSIYGGLAVLANLAGQLDLTVAQTTILCSIMLIAHSLPLELSISSRAGAGSIPMGILRCGGAVVYGIILNWICSRYSLWQHKVTWIFASQQSNPTLLVWTGQQLYNIVLIILVIFGILLLMRLLRAMRVLDAIEQILAPVLPFFGMGNKAAPVTVIGMIMGLGYGGALIIREAGSGDMTREELFFSMALMGLCHALIEDTLLMAAIGGKLIGILWGRIVFSLLVIYFLVHMFARWRAWRGSKTLHL